MTSKSTMTAEEEADWQRGLTQAAAAEPTAPATCSFEGCRRTALTTPNGRGGRYVVPSGLCTRHYEQKRKGEELSPIPYGRNYNGFNPATSGHATPLPEGSCVHHWLLAAPNGPMALGTCKKCNETKAFKTAAEDAIDQWQRLHPRHRPDHAGVSGGGLVAGKVARATGE